jgi:GAF domain-containing protein
VVHRLLTGGPVSLRLEALCTWRDAHGERHADGPPLRTTQLSDGVLVEDAYRLAGPGWQPGGGWHLGAYHREEAGRGLAATEDLWLAGTFVDRVAPGGISEISAWAGPPEQRPPAASVVIAAARERAHDAAELELLGAMAAQIGQFVERRRAEERIALHADHLAAVAELSEQLSRTQDHRAARPTLVSSIRELSAADQVVLLEPDGAGLLVVTAESGGLLPEGLAFDLRTDTAVAIQVFQAGEGRFVPDLIADQSASRTIIARTQLQSAHYEPLVRDGKVVGVLVVAMRQQHTRDAGGLGSLMRLLAAEAAGGLALADALATLDDRARTDGLTGVANRRAWDDALPLELARAHRAGTPVSVAILDLDHFK